MREGKIEKVMGNFGGKVGKVKKIRREVGEVRKNAERGRRRN